jgi:uncharacterized protein
MLPTELLINRWHGEEIVPKRLAIDASTCEIAQALIDIFQTYKGQTKGELNRQLQELEGEATDYRLKRGLAHILTSSFSEFTTVSPLDPPMLRDRVFGRSAASIPHAAQTEITLETIAAELTQELGHAVLPAQIRQGLYADLPDNQILTEFELPPAEALIHRYNLSQVQGIFYRASQVQINAHRNDPGEYKLLFRYMKLFQLMTYIEGDADTGFTLTIDGPTSLFQTSTRYGLAMAKLLPALLHVTKWSLATELQIKDNFSGTLRKGQFSLDADCGLVTHYPPGKPYDSMLEKSFVDRWEKANTVWKLEREVDLIPIPGSVMIPDFRVVHPDGRTYLLEIVGYWRPEYLQKKFAQVRKSNRDDLILAISERLNLEKAGVKFEDTSAKIVYFKDQLLPKAILEILPES